MKYSHAKQFLQSLWPLSVLWKDTYRQERFPSCRAHGCLLRMMSHICGCVSTGGRKQLLCYSTAFPAFHRTLLYSSFITFCKIFSSNQVESKNYCKFVTDLWIYDFQNRSALLLHIIKPPSNLINTVFLSLDFFQDSVVGFLPSWS